MKYNINGITLEFVLNRLLITIHNVGIYQSIYLDENFYYTDLLYNGHPTISIENSGTTVYISMNSESEITKIKKFIQMGLRNYG